MEVAGLALAIVATTDLCFKQVASLYPPSIVWLPTLTSSRYGKRLVETCATFDGAETEVNERVLYIRSHWKRTSTQLNFIKRIWKSLDEEHQAIQTQILQVLVSKLSHIISKLEKLSKQRSGDRATDQQIPGVKRWRYVLIKDDLDEAIEDLASWQKMFDPAWFLIMKVSSSHIDQELSRNGSAVSSLASASSLRDALREDPLQEAFVFLPKDGLDIARAREIPFATAKCVPRAGSDKWLVVDSIPCDPEADEGLMSRDIQY